jgi:hypothetical protein
MWCAAVPGTWRPVRSLAGVRLRGSGTYRVQGRDEICRQLFEFASAPAAVEVGVRDEGPTFQGAFVASGEVEGAELDEQCASGTLFAWSEGRVEDLEHTTRRAIEHVELRQEVRVERLE